ncbi:hypothetical protein PIB30_088671, partial [Stylosanthes scabra]|nr:hypothetical protein [Stylosanthes scabra]
MDVPDSAVARNIRRQIMNQKRKKPRITNNQYNTNATGNCLTSNTSCIEDEIDKGNSNRVAAANQFIKMHDREKRKLPAETAQTSNELQPSQKVDSRKRPALSEIDINSM